jgi:transcriptional regulator with XRE-family HTH domain
MTEQDAQQRERIAARIREARKLSGLSQGQVAQMLGLHRPAVTEVEAANRRVSAQELARMAEIFDVSVAWLLGNTADSLSVDDPRLQLAARELSKLKADDLDRVLRLLAAMRDPSSANENDEPT